MITLENDRLVFRFPDVHEDAICSIDLQRTLRIPDDENDYPLPPGLGSFPIRHLDDYASTIPEAWLERGGVIAPMHQSEAMWISFDCPSGYPFAVKVATGKINAVSGENWVNFLNQDPQDYLVIPEQPWLDGYCVEKGIIRQFVAMPLGEGYSVEEQVTGAAKHGGIQIIVYPIKRDRYSPGKAETGMIFDFDHIPHLDSMGLAPGGRMEQQIYDDPYNLDDWDQRHFSRCFVTIANSAVWAGITGENAPVTPPSAANYTNAGLPWFDYYGEDAETMEGSETLKNIQSVAAIGATKGASELPDNQSVDVKKIIALRKKGSSQVRETAI